MNEPDHPVFDLAILKGKLRAAHLDDQFKTLAWAFIGRFSNDIWRVTLDNGVRLVIKIPCREPRPDENPAVERLFYLEMAHRPDLPIPRFVGDLDGALILEYKDLEEFSFEQGVHETHANAAIDALADWHAAFWESPPRALWLPSFADPGVRRNIQKNYDSAWAAHGKHLLRYAPEFVDIGEALVGRLAETLAPLAEPATLTHGDAHAENVPLTASGALLLDWQDPRIANPGLDLAVFTTMSFREDQRPLEERDLLDRYTLRLKAHGCDWPSPWRDYRLGILRRAARIVEIAGDDFVSLPWVFRRSAVAAVEHQVGDLIR